MDTVGELERLKALFESGALSEQEFADAKAKIIRAGEKVHGPSLAPTSGFAIASLVLGLLVLPSPLGLIFGLIALSQIKKTQGNLKGRGIAIAGVTISAVFSFGLIIVITLTGGIGLSLFQFNKASKKTVHLPAPKLAILPAVKLDTDTNAAFSVMELLPDEAANMNSVFLTASSLFDERAYDKAAIAFEKFYSSNPAGALAPAALFGAAASRAAAQQVEGAIKGYQGVISQFPNSPEATQSRVALAKLYLAKPTPDAVEAKKLLGKVLKDAIPGFWRDEAQRLYDSLESGNKDTKK